MPVEDYLPERQTLWEEVHHNAIDFFIELRNRGDIGDDLFEYEINLIMGAPLEPEEYLTLSEEEKRAKITDALFEEQKSYFATAFREVIRSLWQWILEQLKSMIDLVVGFLKPALQQAWDFCKAQFEEAGRIIYDGAQKLFEGHSPIRPEDAPALAVKLYTFAMGAGVAAHGAATVTELLHPLKRVGLHQTAAMIGDFAGFGRICGATMGPLVNRVLGQLMTYNVQARFRPQIPRESLLIEFRSKREIDKRQFDEAMAYQGFSKEWTDIIERWQWKDPRMFEIIRLADIGLDQGSPPSEEMPWLRRFGVTGPRLKDWWLWRKFMRAGYEDCDIPVMVRFIHRREVAFALTYVRTAIRRNYRWGWLTDEELSKWMERLQLPDQAKTWIRYAGQLDREHFYRSDLVTYYKTSFRNDVIDEDELLVSLLAMGLPAREATIITRTERVRKSPRPARPVDTAVQKAAAEIQKKYITLYLTQYRKDLISDELLEESLLAIGLTPELAEVTVSIEAAKKGTLLTPEPS